MPTHARRCDEAAVREILELFTVQRCHLLLLPSPVLAGGAGTVKSRIEVRRDDLAVVIDLAIEHGALRPGDAGIGDEDVEAVIELLDNVVDDFFNVRSVGDIYLVGFACARSGVKGCSQQELRCRC